MKLISGGGDQILAFFREHAFDYFGAGALVAAVWYLSVNRTAPRVVWLAGVMAFVGALTAFTAGGGASELAIVAVGGFIVGVLLGAVPLPQYLEAINRAVNAQATGRTLSTDP